MMRATAIIALAIAYPALMAAALYWAHRFHASHMVPIADGSGLVLAGDEPADHGMEA